MTVKILDVPEDESTDMLNRLFDHSEKRNSYTSMNGASATFSCGTIAAPRMRARISRRPSAA